MIFIGDVTTLRQAWGMVWEKTGLARTGQACSG